MPKFRVGFLIQEENILVVAEVEAKNKKEAEVIGQNLLDEACLRVALKKRKIKVAVAGATGYAGREIVNLLLKHPYADISQIVAPGEAGQSISRALPQFAKVLDVPLEKKLRGGADVYILAVREDVSMELVPQILRGEFD